jgi:hypothetical protein
VALHPSAPLRDDKPQRGETRGKHSLRHSENMATLYLIVSIILGGCLALFGAAGWSSYKDKKLPNTPDLFRWFVAGSLSSGLAAYAWMFGAGGDPSALLEKLGDTLEMKEIAETLTSAVGNAGSAAVESDASVLT